MPRRWVVGSVGAVVLLATLSFGGIHGPAHAMDRCVSRTDPGGFTTVRCIDGTRGRLFTDRAGLTTGWIGDQSVTIRQIPSGRAVGHIGHHPFEAYTDRFGTTRGRLEPPRTGLPRQSGGLKPLPVPLDFSLNFVCQAGAAGTKRRR